MNFTRIVKYLDVLKTRKATSGEVPFRNQKYFGISKARAIKKIPVVLYVDKFSYAAGDSPRSNSCLLFQFNVNMEKDFHIINMETDFFENGNWGKVAFGALSSIAAGGDLYAKFREDSDVTRYRLTGSGVFVNIDNNYSAGAVPMKEVYTSGNLLKKNFCLEYWLQYPPLAGTYGIIKPVRFVTSIMTNPSYPEQTEIAINLGAPITIDDMGFTLPHAMPITQETLVFDNN